MDSSSTFFHLLLLLLLLLLHHLSSSNKFVLTAASGNRRSCHPSDLRALRGFASNLANGWSTLRSWSAISPHCCAWDGISCSSSNGSHARVLSLLLPARGLNGTLPNSLAHLHNLTRLDLSRNHLSGSLPTGITDLRSLTHLDLSSNGDLSGSPSGFLSLTYLNLSGNAFAGRIDAAVCSGFRGLEILDLSSNRFAGSLPEDCFANCSSTLRKLLLDSNSLSGDLPGSLFGLLHLSNLSVSWNDLSGRISVGLGNLSRARSLVLAGNRFDGPLPDVFGRLPMLEELVVHSNSFSGNLPPSLSLCSLLRKLDLRNNSLSGLLDLDFSRMPALESLDLASNRFVGTLPVSLSSCSLLKTVSLGKNGLQGQIPVEFGNLASLAFLSLSNNTFHNISGALSTLRSCKNLTTLILTMNFYGEEIPESVGGYDNLSVLAIGNCGLTGRIPRWLRSFKKVEVLDLSWNHLNGTIPTWVGELDSLFYLDISNNSLTGEIPPSLTRLKALMLADDLPQSLSMGVPLYVKQNRSSSGRQYNQVSGFPPSLYLNDNELSGSIWPEFGKLKQLHVLDLSNNCFVGVIPQTISQMENLEVLDLSYNKLHGRIPDSLNKLTFLSEFSVAYNHLEGEIPSGGQFFSFSNSSYEGNSGLCVLLNSSCGTVPAVEEVASSPQNPPRKGKSGGKGRILGLTIGIVVGIAALTGFLLLNMSTKEMEEPLFDGNKEGRSEYPMESLGSKLVLLFHDSVGKELTIADVVKAANNFDQQNIIGCGGFGMVYKASLPDGTRVAIKKLSGDCGQIEREFQAEIEVLSKAQHENLVSLKGYCKHAGDHLLIYSYMENGSLDYWLHEKEDGVAMLKWESRLKIAQGAARGLAYLHILCRPNIIHRDIKSSNILLDERFEAHLADFGLSRIIQPYDTHVTTDLVGTLGYIPPEYSQTLTATKKGDMFSFGAVLLELLTGRRPLDVCKIKGNRDLVSWARQMKLENKEELIFDPLIWNKAHERQLLAVLEIACKCINTDPKLRPSIDHVVSWLDSVG